MRTIEVIAFDLFGTIHDAASYADRRDLERYWETISDKSGWRPFRWEPYWEKMPAFDDCVEGLGRLQVAGYKVVTLSNAPLALTVRMARSSQLSWDAIIPLEAYRIYKPDLRCYQLVPHLLQVPAEKCLMVSGNKKFGDIEGAKQCGLKSQLIRNPGCPKDLHELCEWLADGKI